MSLEFELSFLCREIELDFRILLRNTWLETSCRQIEIIYWNAIASKNVSKWGPPFINECISLKTFQFPKQQQRDAIFYECNLMHSIELGTDKISVSWCSRADPGIKFGQYKPNFSADKPTSSEQLLFQMNMDWIKHQTPVKRCWLNEWHFKSDF